MLNRPEDRPGALGELRMMIEKIVLTPGPIPGEIEASLHRRLGRFLNWTARQAVEKSASALKGHSQECRRQWLRGLATTETDI